MLSIHSWQIKGEINKIICKQKQPQGKIPRTPAFHSKWHAFCRKRLLFSWSSMRQVPSKQRLHLPKNLWKSESIQLLMRGQTSSARLMLKGLQSLNLQTTGIIDWFNCTRQDLKLTFRNASTCINLQEEILKS